MENYAGSSTLLIFDVASASFIVGTSVWWLAGDFLDNGRAGGPISSPVLIVPLPLCLGGFVAELIVEDLRGTGGNGGR